MKKRKKKRTSIKPGSKPPLRRSFTRGQRDLNPPGARRAWGRLDAQSNANADQGPPDAYGGSNGY